MMIKQTALLSFFTISALIVADSWAAKAVPTEFLSFSDQREITESAFAAIQTNALKSAPSKATAGDPIAEAAQKAVIGMIADADQQKLAKIEANAPNGVEVLMQQPDEDDAILSLGSILPNAAGILTPVLREEREKEHEDFASWNDRMLNGRRPAVRHHDNEVLMQQPEQPDPDAAIATLGSVLPNKYGEGTPVRRGELEEEHEEDFASYQQRLLSEGDEGVLLQEYVDSEEDKEARPLAPVASIFAPPREDFSSWNDRMLNFRRLPSQQRPASTELIQDPASEAEDDTEVVAEQEPSSSKAKDIYQSVLAAAKPVGDFKVEVPGYHTEQQVQAEQAPAGVLLQEPASDEASKHRAAVKAYGAATQDYERALERYEDLLTNPPGMPALMQMAAPAPTHHHHWHLLNPAKAPAENSYPHDALLGPPAPKTALGSTVLPEESAGSMEADILVQETDDTRSFKTPGWESLNREGTVTADTVTPQHDYEQALDRYEDLMTSTLPQRPASTELIQDPASEAEDDTEVVAEQEPSSSKAKDIYQSVLAAAKPVGDFKVEVPGYHTEQQVQAEQAPAGVLLQESTDYVVRPLKSEEGEEAERGGHHVQDTKDVLRDEALRSLVQLIPQDFEKACALARGMVHKAGLPRFKQRTGLAAMHCRKTMKQREIEAKGGKVMPLSRDEYKKLVDLVKAL